MKKRSKIILIVIASIVLLGIIFGIVDNIRAQDEKTPLFAINIGKDDNTNATLYYGLGYVVVKCPPISETLSYVGNDFIKFQILSSRHACVK